MTARPSLFKLSLLGAATVLATGHSLAQEDTNEIPQIRPPHAQLTPTFWELHGTMIILAAVLMVILVGVVVWLLTRPKPPVVIPPAVQARTALAALPASLSESDRLSRVSQILRDYVQGAFELPQVELNTTEFCLQVANHPAIGPELAGALAEFLKHSDRRKFSREPSPASTVNAVTQALKLIEQGEARRASLRTEITPANQPA